MVGTNSMQKQGQYISERTSHEGTGDLLCKVSETRTGGEFINGKISPLEIND